MGGEAMHKTDKEAKAQSTQLDFIQDLTSKGKRNSSQSQLQRTHDEPQEDELEHTSPLAGRISGTMEDLERLQSTEMTATDEVKECIKDSLECYQNCTETRRRCISLGGRHAEPKHINLLVDCAKICSINADFMLRESTYYPQTCGLAADICDECADDCERFEEPFMRECALVCRRCAESCREMAR